jgi:hypothetical protein
LHRVVISFEAFEHYTLSLLFLSDGRPEQKLQVESFGFEMHMKKINQSAFVCKEGERNDLGVPLRE